MPWQGEERDITEDLLRRLLEAEHLGQPGTELLLADKPELAPEMLRAVLERARASGLVTVDGESWRLTEAGREHAVRVMRAHRLIETRLARESSLPPEQWHRRAHLDEHRLSSDEINRLADRLDNPRFDPHGDPIPTRDGHLPEPEGEPLQSWASDRPGVISHIEDEPPRLFARLASLSVHAGERFVVKASSPQGLHLDIEGREVMIPSELAALIRVRALSTGESLVPAGAYRLSQLSPGAAANVVQLLPGCAGAERSRLLDLGFVPGSRIEHVLQSPFNGPAAFRVRGTLIALRREQAQQVLVTPAEN